MIEFGPSGIKSYGFGSGQGSTRGRTTRVTNATAYPDSSDTLRRHGIRPGTCRRCNRGFIAGPGYERHCKPCTAAISAADEAE